MRARRLRWLPAALVGAFGLGCACFGPRDCPPGTVSEADQCVAADCLSESFDVWDDDAYVYVDGTPFGPEDGFSDGSASWPFLTIAEAIGPALARGVPVMIAPGHYDEVLALDSTHDGLVIRGMCSTTTSLTGSSGSSVTLDGGPDTVVRIEDLRVYNEAQAGIVVTSGLLALDDVSVDRAVGSGILVQGRTARIEVGTAEIVDVGGGEDDAVPSYGLVAADGGVVVGAGLTIRRVGVAAALIDGANAVLAGFETDGGGIDPLASDDDPQPGGVIVTNGGALTLSDAVLLGSWAVGIELSAGSTARLDDVALHGVRAGGGPAPDGGFGSGVTVLDGSTLDAIDLTIDGTALYGLAASGVGSAVTVAGGAVSDDAPDPAQDSAGFGVVADLGATVDLVDVSIARTHLYAVIASGAGTTLVLTDVDATDTQPTAAFAVGGGLLVQEGATAVATRLAVTGSDTVGVLVDASTATFDGLTVVDTRRGPLQSTAVGVAAQAGAVLDATGLDVRRTAGPGLVVSDARVTCGGCALAANAFAGLVVADGGDVGFTGGSIDDTVSDATEGGGVGAYVASGPYRSALTLDGAALAGNLHAGVYVDGDGDVALTDVTVSGGPVTRAVYPTGTAVYAHGTTIAGLSIADSTIADSDGAGVFLDAASASLSGNRYRANAVDVVQQLCSAATPTPAGLDAEPTDAVELCPPLDRPVDGFVFSTVYDPVAL